MTTITAAQAQSEPLTTNQSIEDRVMSLIGSAYKRQLWLLLLDDHGMQLPVVVPIDDLPPSPTHVEIDSIASFCADLMTLHGAAQLVAVWERKGRGRLEPGDAIWPRTLASACERRGVDLRAQLLCHSRGSCILSPSDYAEADPTRPSVASNTGGTGC